MREQQLTSLSDEAVQALVAAVERICAEVPLNHRPEPVRQALRAVLARPGVRAAFAERPLSHSGPHGLWFDLDGRFSILLYEWQPGGRSPIHDHWCWGAVAGIHGSEREDTYALDATDRAAPTGVGYLQPGDTTAFPAGPAAIHRVACHGPIAARSLHIYGGDISRTNLSSIDRVYEPADARVAEVATAR